MFSGHFKIKVKKATFYNVMFDLFYYASLVIMYSTKFH